MNPFVAMIASKDPSLRGAIIQQYNPQGYKQLQEGYAAQDTSNAYAKLNQAMDNSGIQPGTKEYWRMKTRLASESGDPQLVNEVAYNYEKDQQNYDFNPQADPMLTSDLKEYVAVTGDSGLQNKGAINAFLNQANSSRGTRVSVNAYNPSPDNSAAFVPLDLQKMVVDESGNPAQAPVTYGEIGPGKPYRIQDKERTADAQKANQYSFILDQGRKALVPLMQEDGLLGKDARDDIQKNPFSLKNINAQYQQSATDLGLPDMFLSNQGKMLKQSGNLISEPILRTMTGSAAGEGEQPRIKAMFSPSVNDSDAIQRMKLDSIAALSTMYKGQAAGRIVTTPQTPDDVYLGSSFDSNGNELVLGFNPQTQSIYANLPDGRNVPVTHDDMLKIIKKQTGGADVRY